MKLRKVVVSLFVLCLIVLLNTNAYGLEDNSVVLDNSEEEIVNIIENENNDESKEVEILTYRMVIEKIIQTLNERDSYFFELRNPTDYVKYLKDEKVELPKDLDSQVTRIGFASLLTDILCNVVKETPYTTELVDVRNIFTDLTELSEEEIESVQIVFLQGLLSGTSNTTFSPYSDFNEYQLNIILERLKTGYTRQNVFNVVKSGFTNEERQMALDGQEDKELTYQDMISCLYNFSETPRFNEYIEDILTIGDFLELYYNKADYQILVRDDETDEYYYPAKDTIILSAEEWEYLNNNKDKIMMLSEAKIFTQRIVAAKEDSLNYTNFESIEEVEKISNNYLNFMSNLVSKYKNCISYFMDFNNNKRNPFGNYNDFSRAVHEAQHEGSAVLSGEFAGRRKTDTMWQVRWSSRPFVYYYFDFTNSTWVDSRNLYGPNTSVIYNKCCTDEIKEDWFLKDYATNDDLVANIYGLQGLLQEYCSYGLEAKIEFVNYSLSLGNSGIGYTNYDWFLLMKYMVIESLNYWEENNKSIYDSFMKDTDMVRFLNNTFKELDYYEYIYRDKLDNYIFWFTDGLLEWGYDLGCPVSFAEFEKVEEVEISVEL